MGYPTISVALFLEEFGFDFLYGQPGRRYNESPQNMAPDDRLELRRISIESPGFWEFFGALNPLQQIREYLKDRHERRKDVDYRDAAGLLLESELLQRQITEKENGILRDQLQSFETLDFLAKRFESSCGPSLGLLFRGWGDTKIMD